MTFVSGATTVTFTGTLYPTEYESERHQNYGESGDGTIRVYDRSVKVQFIRIDVRDDHDNLTNIRSFIEDTVKMRHTTFTYTPDAGHNVGNGDGGAITVRYWLSNFIERQTSYHIYRYPTITLRREVS